MAPDRDSVKTRIKSREQNDPELDDALNAARDLARQKTAIQKNSLSVQITLTDTSAGSR